MEAIAEEDIEIEGEDANNKTIKKLEELRDELVMLERDLEDLKENTGIGMDNIIRTLNIVLDTIEELEGKIEHLETRFQNFLDNIPYILPP